MVPMKKCRTCGREYEPCHNTGNSSGAFRWREVACSPECGEIYLQRILESRGLVPKKEKKARAKKAKVAPVEVEVTKTPVVTDKVVADSEVKVDILDSNRD